MSPRELAAIGRRLNLTARQRQVVELLLSEAKDQQIASSLGIRLRTVRSHITELFERLGVATRLGIAVEIFRAYRDIAEKHPVEKDSGSGAGILQK